MGTRLVRNEGFYSAKVTTGTHMSLRLKHALTNFHFTIPSLFETKRMPLPHELVTLP